MRILTAELDGTCGLPREMLGMDGELNKERSDKLPCWLLLLNGPPYGVFSVSSWIGVLFPAVGLDCELFTIGGELGPDSGLLAESKN